MRERERERDVMIAESSDRSYRGEKSELIRWTEASSLIEAREPDNAIQEHVA